MPRDSHETTKLLLVRSPETPDVTRFLVLREQGY